MGGLCCGLQWFRTAKGGCYARRKVNPTVLPNSGWKVFRVQNWEKLKDTLTTVFIYTGYLSTLFFSIFKFGEWNVRTFFSVSFFYSLYWIFSSHMGPTCYPHFLPGKYEFLMTYSSFRQKTQRITWKYQMDTWLRMDLQNTTFLLNR